MMDTHPGYEWEKGKVPRRVDVAELKDGLARLPPMPVGSSMARAHQNYLDNKRKEFEAKAKSPSKNKRGK